MEYRSTGKTKGNKKSEIIRYIFEHKNASKTELTKKLNLSMPTVLQNTKDLVEKGILIESGEYESTGGRRAKTLAMNGKAAYSIGMDITLGQVTLVLLNFAGIVIEYVRKKKEFHNTLDYYRELAEELEHFIQSAGINKEMILGIGVTLPGIINDEKKIVIKSHVLKLEGTSLKIMEQFIPYPIHFENDANAAMLAESDHASGDAIYLFLSNTVGGAFKIGGKIYRGRNRKAGEFGHTVIVPNGRACYCGKRGCVDSYCSVRALESAGGLALDEFMKRVDEKDRMVMPIWQEYLEYLAVTVTNLRMMYDTDIILGGDIGEYLESHMLEFGKRVMEYNKFDTDISYLKSSTYKKGSAAVGVALHFIYQCINDFY